MRGLVLASQKGGAGKTTLSRHLAVEAERAGAGPVVLLDADPQGGLAAWWNRRRESLRAAGWNCRGSPNWKTAPG